MSKVTYLECTYARVPPDGVLEGAKGKLSDVFVIGESVEGLYTACSSSDAKDMLWMLERAKAEVMRQVEASEGKGPHAA